MSSQNKKDIKAVIVYLDSLMQVNPSKELADCSNYLESLTRGI